MSEDIMELENKIRNLKLQKAEKERLERLNKEETFRKRTKVYAYSASDYAGLETGNYSFYYGYEETYCPKHKNKNCEDYGCELREWAFVAKCGDKEIMRIPASELWFEYKEIEEMLLLGIGRFISDTKEEDK